jgi:hypothetical protein
MGDRRHLSCGPQCDLIRVVAGKDEVLDNHRGGGCDDGNDQMDAATESANE